MIDPAALVAALTAAGFTTVGGRSGAYTRMGWPPHLGERGTLVVSIDPTAPEHESMTASLLLQLRRSAEAGAAAGAVLAALGEEVAA
ncbi:hypothetical protein [Dactylosporangium sp. CA-139066]|uniref:hypothetical protein n=1 Tax=Dactylosporangium sp. CA-139066 TaxID=3239930 RepID=UPI003D92DEB1